MEKLSLQEQYLALQIRKLQQEERERMVKIIFRKSAKQEVKKPKEKVNECLRRPVAFAICLLYINGKYDIAQMTKDNLKKFISLNFENISAQRVLVTLLNYDNRFKNEKAVFWYEDHSWQFRDDNFNYMKETYPEDFKKGTELFNTLK